MDSLDSINHSTSHNHEDNSNFKLNDNTQIIIENNSSDITISKCDEIRMGKEPSNNLIQNSVSIKSQVLPVVYIQNNNNNNNNKTSSNNNSNKSINNGNSKNNDDRNAGKILLSTLNPVEKKCNTNRTLNNCPTTIVNSVNKLNAHVSTVSVSSSQNVIITSNRGPKPLVLPKPPAITLNAKVASSYLSMVKNMTKSDSQLTSYSEHGVVAAPQKFVITPVSKITANRSQSTVTTNSVQPRITVLPMPVPQSDNDLPPSQKVYNFQIADGKLQYSNFSSPLTIMRETKRLQKSKDTADTVSKKALICNEKIDLSIDEDSDINDKTYELSIPDELNNIEDDNRHSISIIDSNSAEEQTNSNNQQALKFPQGVSILKKNFLSNLLQESKKSDNYSISNKSNIDKDITITKLNNITDDQTTLSIKTKLIDSKSDKDRDKTKSQYNCSREEYTEMVIDLEKFAKDQNLHIKKENKAENEMSIKSDDMEIELEVTQLGNGKYPRNMFNPDHKDSEAAKLLKWEDGVGLLPGSTLRFTINEFDMIEYISEGDYQKVIDSKIQKAKEKEDMEREIRCVECGCYGMRADFISDQFCSTECQEVIHKKPHVTVETAAAAATTKKNVKRKFVKSKSDNDIKESNNEISAAEEENSSDTMPPDKVAYPWACKKKGFSWSKYLTHVNAKAAPMKLFKDPFPYNRNGFKAGMKLEGVDPQHPSYFCILTVVDAVGYRIRLHFDGYSENYDFWVNADSSDIFPVGWCEKYGHSLHLPPGYNDDTFSWMQYLKITKSTGAPKHLFPNRHGQAICPNGFRIGMKLEAVDKKDSSLTCVATVKDMMDNRLLIHFDGWDDIYDYWADPTSPYIHPVGWCDQSNHKLTPPSDHPNPENFLWETYLKESKAVAAPTRAFKLRSACGFKKGMRLECVDKRVPNLIRVATIDDVKGHQIRIHFDGWPEKYSYWVDDDNPDIHPVGWCQKTGHPIEPPLTPDDVYDFLECPTVGCRGQGHILGLKFITHSNPKHCPYAEDNINVDRVLPDRLLSPDNNPEVKVPVSREPKETKLKPRVGRPPKWLKQITMSQMTKEHEDEPPEKKQKRQLPKLKKHKPVLKLTAHEKKTLEKAQKIIKNSKILPAERESWKKHSNFLNEYVSSHENPFDWTVYDVAEFVTSIPGCESNEEIFKEQDFDGEALLLLKQSDILDLLKIKIGPAIKLYNSIVLLRNRCWK